MPLISLDTVLERDEFFYNKVKEGEYQVLESGVILNSRGNPIGYPNQAGYIRIDRSAKDGYKRMYTSAHRMVARWFLGPIPEHYEVNHIDNVHGNNHLDNLEVVTGSENVKHFHANMSRRPNATKEEKECMVNLYLSGVRRTVIAEMFDVDYRTVMNAVKQVTDFRHIQACREKKIELQLAA